jgi:hypothetical protein
MPRQLTLIFLCAILTPVSSHADISLTPKTTIRFASATEGRKVLMAKDDYVQRLSGFDRSARLKVDRLVAVDEFLAFAGTNTVDWSESEEQRVQESIRALQPALLDLHLSLPGTVNMIRTTGAEEGNAAYTRGVSIVLPKKELEVDQKTLTKLICHELFHVLSRQNPALRDKLYEIIGFHRCAEVNLPPELASHKITNPDAPKNDHFIRLKIDGRDCMAIPILLSSEATYNVERGGEFFDYLTFVLMLVKKDAATGQISTALNDGKPLLLPPQSTPDYLKQIGTNTKYIIHPEEILADNFALLVLGEQNVPSPEILQKMKTILTNSRP